MNLMLGKGDFLDFSELSVNPTENKILKNELISLKVPNTCRLETDEVHRMLVDIVSGDVTSCCAY